MTKQNALRGLALTVLVLGLASCTAGKLSQMAKSGAPSFDGQYFLAGVEGVDGDNKQFVVTVKDPARSPKGARAAGDYEAVGYCIQQFGTSDHSWSLGPDATDAQLISGNVMTLRGTCAGW
ncbi:hypothetical protein KM176_01540 [Pseudooceanicola sp. CBS1P-1]|uniref:Lipoprotein n=1 Tax=Pseudooceanicola albus TaxID=2692189 RepID=A0A6L7G0M6_9RHOB|nr:MULTISPECIES: hypothetical protein [Pseudooceanicola]MBT9382529.1 hypothetical protein [Pseudooceanicola endophyticus]MXN17070.1 hypothetical protein [Pseudooceanicola albus]